MFTGLITDIGTLDNISLVEKGAVLRIETNYDLNEIDIGASIACAGVCLTVTKLGSTKSPENNWFEVEAWEEALRLTTIGNWQAGDKINLERSLKLGDEMGGHLVSGHVDCQAKIIDMVSEGEATRYILEAPTAFARFIAPKGSVALDGTSLTVNKVDGAKFDVLLIRHSQEVTTWGMRKVDDFVNLEIDQLARYVERLATFK